MSAYLIDAFDFCHRHETVDGVYEVAALPRLVRECTDASGQLHWSLQGAHGKFDHPQLKLAVAGSLHLMCQRCLQPYAFSLDTHSTLVLAADDASADAIEQQIDDDAVDVIVGTHQMDVMALVEDDALLALPFAPVHEVCPSMPAGAVNEAVNVQKPSPFAVLQELASRRRDT